MNNYYYSQRFGCEKIDWPDHWTNGGDAVTKFTEDKLKIFQDAISDFGDVNLWIKKEDSTYYSLRDNQKRGDLSKFWECFREREKEVTNK